MNSIISLSVRREVRIMDSIAYLVHQNHTKDEIGQNISGGETLLEVFVTVNSVSRAEFFNAGRNGLTPEFVFVMPKINYSGEKEIQYDGKRYSIYRTFCPPESDDIELYVKEEAGVKNG